MIHGDTGDAAQALKIGLKSVILPDFGHSVDPPEISRTVYSTRVDRIVERAQTDWLAVYADREHAANMLHLCGFDPRFEEALLLLGKNGTRVLLVGNESIDYAALARLDNLRPMLCQSLSLMGQDRSTAPSLAAVIRDAGLDAGQTVGVIGWKYLLAEEGTSAFVVPHHMIAALAEVAGGIEQLHDETALLMHPETGDRAIVDADQIGLFEWATSRASSAVWRIVSGARPGMSEYEAAALMGYAGEPLSCHVMLASPDANGRLIGLRSPTARHLEPNKGVTTAIGYWGGLSCRAGMLSGAQDAPGFMDLAAGYFRGLVTWYRTARIGVTGGDIHDAVANTLAASGLKSALNPGHLLGYDEWINSPIRPGSTERIRSGMAFQVDIIPTPIPAGQALNCEDTVVFADQALRAEIANRHPETFARIKARRDFVSSQIGLELDEDILPLSNIHLCLPPDWSEPQTVLSLLPNAAF